MQKSYKSSFILMAALVIFVGCAAIRDDKPWHHEGEWYSEEEYAKILKADEEKESLEKEASSARTRTISERRESVRISREARPYMQRGRRLMKEERYEEAAEAFKKYLQFDARWTSRAIAYTDLVRCYRKLRQWQNAIEIGKKEIKEKPDYSLAYHGLAETYLAMGRYKDAIAHFKKAVAKKNSIAYSYEKMGWTYLKLAQHKNALKAFKTAIRTRSISKSHTEVTKDEKKRKLIDADLAILAHKMAIKLKTDDPKRHVQLGFAYAKLDYPKEAINSYKQAIKLDIENADAHSFLAATYGDMHRFEDAISTYKRALKLKPDYPAGIYYELGQVYEEEGELSNTIARTIAGMGEEYRNKAQKSFMKAISAYQQAIKLAPKHARAHYSLGLNHLRIGNKETAILIYKKLKKMDTTWADMLFDLIYK